jgi:hypothetical protein
MSKDPAVLFYTSDFLSGTFTMTNEQVGKYIRLLCLQHQKGKLSEKDMLSICSAYDVDIWDKFKIEDGAFINERMYNEAIRRQKFTESRRNNAKSPKNDSTSKAYALHMETETETINENKTINKTKAKVKEIPILFRDSIYNDIKVFSESFLGTQYEGANFNFYYEKVKNWSDSKNNKKIDWIATAKNWMADDMANNKFIDINFNPNAKRINTNQQLSYAEREAARRNSL